MGLELLNSYMPMLRQYAAVELLCCNEETAAYGLMLTPVQAMELVEVRDRSLVALGRVELGNGILDKLIHAFCDSPYLSSYNYTETLHELTECFYEYKNETLDLMDDDELISRMKELFDGVCKGSIELLRERELVRIAENLRFGRPPDEKEEDDEHDGYDEYDGFETARGYRPE